MNKELKYKIDVVQTLLANLVNIIFMIILLVLFAMYMTQIRTFENETNQLIGFIFGIISFVRLIHWCVNPKAVLIGTGFGLLMLIISGIFFL